MNERTVIVDVTESYTLYKYWNEAAAVRQVNDSIHLFDKSTYTTQNEKINRPFQTFLFSLVKY